MDAKDYKHEEVERLRRDAGLTQAQFADELEVVPMTVYRVEKGIAVSFELLQKIATRFNVAVPDLLRTEPSTDKKISVMA